MNHNHQNTDDHWMRLALEQASKAEALSEIPVGAIVVYDGQVIGEGYNCPISTTDPTAHAEIQALRDAAKRVGNYRLPGATLYVTLEPCSMCAGAIVHSRVGRVVFAATEPKSGVAVSQGRFFDAPFLNHKVACDGGVLEELASAQISQFFQYRREQKKRLKRISPPLSGD